MKPTLERKPIDLEDFDEVRLEAWRLLGYEHETRSHQLEAALQKLAIAPFTPQSVARYKAAKVSRARASFADGMFGFAWMFSVIAAGCGLAGIPIWTAGGPVVPLVICAGMSIASAFAIGVAWAFKDVRSGNVWQRVKIKDYRQPVPEFALQTAVDVARACPDVVISIDELQESADPFLVASIGEAHYYLEVWNEKDFKQERVA